MDIKCHFLRNTSHFYYLIQSSFKFKFQRFKYGIQISNLADNNIEFIKNELAQINTDMETDIPMKRLFYLRATDFNWYAANGNIRTPSTFGTVIL